MATLPGRPPRSRARAKDPDMTLQTAVQIKERIEAASKEICDAANDKNFAQIASKHYAPYVCGFHSMDHELWSVSTGEKLIADIEHFLKSNPRFHTTIEDISVDLNDTMDQAVVWMVRTDTGLEDGVRRETVIRLTWTQGGSDWKCTDSSGIRHFPFYTIEALRGGGI